MAILRAGARVVSLTAALNITALFLTSIGISASPALADQNSAIAKYNGKDYQGALNDFKAVVEKDPKNGFAWYYMALCNQCLARVDEAKKDYKWVVDNGPPNLKANAQAGLSQLEKVNSRTGGSASSASTSTASTAGTAPASGTTGGTGKMSKDLIDRSASASKDAGKEAKGSAAPAKTAAATSNIDKVIEFFSESARACQLTEPSWEEAKAKYPKLNFQKVNPGDPLCEKYGVSEYPTIIVLDKNGKALATQAGQQSTESICTAIDSCLSKK